MPPGVRQFLDIEASDDELEEEEEDEDDTRDLEGKQMLLLDVFYLLIRLMCG